METLRATEPLHTGGAVLIPVQRVLVEESHGFGGSFLHVALEPRAIVVNARERWRALDLAGAEIALEPLLEEVAGLAAAIDRERGNAD